MGGFLWVGIMVSIDTKSLCAVCAWRENCKKKYRVAAGEAHCPDFSRDLNLKADNDKQKPVSNGEVKS